MALDLSGELDVDLTEAEWSLEALAPVDNAAKGGRGQPAVAGDEWQRQACGAASSQSAPPAAARAEAAGADASVGRPGSRGCLFCSCVFGKSLSYHDHMKLVEWARANGVGRLCSECKCVQRNIFSEEVDLDEFPSWIKIPRELDEFLDAPRGVRHPPPRGA